MIRGPTTSIINHLQDFYLLKSYCFNLNESAVAVTVILSTTADVLQLENPDVIDEPNDTQVKLTTSE
jgi:hypothetical protein